MKTETKFEYLNIEKIMGFILGNILVVGVGTITLSTYSFVQGKSGISQSAAMAESSGAYIQRTGDQEEIAPRSIGVITTKEKHILDMAIQLCKEGNVSPKGMGPCVERESKEMGLK